MRIQKAVDKTAGKKIKEDKLQNHLIEIGSLLFTFIT